MKPASKQMVFAMKRCVLIALLLILGASQAQAQDYLKVGWGSSRQEVHRAETGQLVTWDAVVAWYQEFVDNQKYMTRYRFIGDTLAAVTRYPIPEHLGSSIDEMLEQAEKLGELQRAEIEALGGPDFVDDHPELRVKHFSWNLGEIYAIAQVDKDDGSGEIWYAPGQLTGSKRKKRYLNKKGALREKYRELTGEDVFSFDRDEDLPADLVDNPTLSARDKLEAVRDEMEGRTIYKDPSTGRNKADDELALYLIEQDGGENSLVLNKTYSASDWLFINSIVVLADGERFTVDDIFDQISRETTYGGIKETYRAYVAGDLEPMVRAIAQAKEAKMRLRGQNSHRDLDITEREKRAMRNVLTFYVELATSR